jgi:hypothetical protein
MKRVNGKVEFASFAEPVEEDRERYLRLRNGYKQEIIRITMVFWPWHPSSRRNIQSKRQKVNLEMMCL